MESFIILDNINLHYVNGPEVAHKERPRKTLICINYLVSNYKYVNFKAKYEL